MRIFYVLLITALFTITACDKKKDDHAKTDPAKTDPAAKTGEPGKTEPGKTEPAKTEPAKAGAMSIDELGSKMVSTTEKIGAAVKGAGGDCAKMGAALKPFAGEMKALMEAGKAFDSDEAKKKELDAKYNEKMMKQVEDFMPAAEKCKDNAEVKAFFESMD